MMNQTSHTILQLTDTHLFDNEDDTLLNLFTRKSFEAILKQVTKDHITPDHIVLSGDLAQDDKPETYHFLFDTITKQFTCPFSCIPGNHDDFAALESTLTHFDCQNPRSVQLGDWQIILLNSQEIGKVPGRLSSEELTFLQQSLQQSSAKAITIYLHHHVYPVRAEWLDNLNLLNADEFLSVVFNDHRIKLVVSGHVHQESHHVRGGVTFLSSPSTCFQFRPLCESFTVDTVMPGYRWLTLNENGDFTTHIQRLDYSAEWLPEQSSQGY